MITTYKQLIKHAKKSGRKTSTSILYSARSGTVAPVPAPASQQPDTRNWIVGVLGGSERGSSIWSHGHGPLSLVPLIATRLKRRRSSTLEQLPVHMHMQGRACIEFNCFTSMCSRSRIELITLAS
jgi:hypothetical protein